MSEFILLISVGRAWSSTILGDLRHLPGSAPHGCHTVSFAVLVRLGQPPSSRSTSSCRRSASARYRYRATPRFQATSWQGPSTGGRGGARGAFAPPPAPPALFIPLPALSTAVDIIRAKRKRSNLGTQKDCLEWTRDSIPHP
jgi:hypothetical protein